MSEIVAGLIVGTAVPAVVLLGPYLPYLFHRTPRTDRVIAAMAGHWETTIRVAGRSSDG